MIQPHVGPLSLRGADKNRACLTDVWWPTDFLGTPVLRLSLCEASGGPFCVQIGLQGVSCSTRIQSMDLHDYIARSYDANCIVMFM